MRVACDLQAVTGPRRTGLGVATDLLLRALEMHAPGIEMVRLRPNLRDKPLRTVLDRLAWEQWRLPARLRDRTDEVELLLSPALGVPLSSPVPTVAYVHDLIPLHYPWQFRGMAGWYWKHLLPQAWRSCSALVVSNAAVAADVQHLLGYSASRIFIAPYCVDQALARQAQEQRDPEPGVGHARFVCIGTHEPRKNFELALRAAGKLAASSSFEVELDIVGMQTGHTAALRQVAATEAAKATVRIHTEYMPREEVNALLRAATALIFPSRYEGFGLPPLEAMSLGCPVVLSDIPAHRAVFDDNERWAGCAPAAEARPPFVSPDDPQQVAGVLRRMAEGRDWRHQLAISGLAYSATFTATATAAGLVDAFEAVVPGDRAAGH